MTELTRRALHSGDNPPASTSRQEDETGRTMLLRWVERPDGRMELLEIPLTREDYLNPKLGDQWVQGRAHSDNLMDMFGRLHHWARSRPEMLVVSDLRHRLGPGFPKPSPDLSIIRGARNPDKVQYSYDVVKQGVPPCLIIEVISPRDPRIRKIDEVDKVDLYQRAGVSEYLLVELPRQPPEPFRIFGYRLDPAGAYQRIVPDEEGGLLSEATGLWFGITPEGDGAVVRDAATGEPLPNVDEAIDARDREAAARQVAEAKAAAEVEARQAVEDELARLRAEIERLRRSP